MELTQQQLPISLPAFALVMDSVLQSYTSSLLPCTMYPFVQRSQVQSYMVRCSAGTHNHVPLQNSIVVYRVSLHCLARVMKSSRKPHRPSRAASQTMRYVSVLVGMHAH